MKKYKNRILLQEYLDKAESKEAKAHLLQIEKEYQSARSKQEQDLRIQDANFYQGLNDGLHVPYQEQQYLDFKDDQRLRLNDEYLSQGKEAFDYHHPEQAQEEQKQSAIDQQKETETAKTVNEGYLMEKYEPELSQQIGENIHEITQEGANHDLKKGQELGLEEKRAEEMSEFKENSLELSEDKEHELHLKTDNELDLEVDTETEKEGDELSIKEDGGDIEMDENSKDLESDLDINEEHDLSEDSEKPPQADISPSMNDD